MRVTGEDIFVDSHFGDVLIVVLKAENPFEEARYHCRSACNYIIRELNSIKDYDRFFEIFNQLLPYLNFILQYDCFDDEESDCYCPGLSKVIIACCSDIAELVNFRTACHRSNYN